MHGAVDWGKRKRTLDGVFGINPYHSDQKLPPTEKQIELINEIVKKFEDNGIDVSWVLKGKAYLRHRCAAFTVIRQLSKMMIEHGLYGSYRVEYVNLCRHKETGKKIRYRTSKFCSAPKGYEFIGQISKETIVEE